MYLLLIKGNVNGYYILASHVLTISRVQREFLLYLASHFVRKVQLNLIVSHLFTIIAVKRELLLYSAHLKQIFQSFQTPHQNLHNSPQNFNRSTLNLSFLV